MSPVKKIIALSILSITVLNVLAQPPKTTRPATAAQKPKPKLMSSVGGYKDSVTVSVDAANDLITKPILVTDDKKVTYTIATYQFLYRKNGVIEDLPEEGGSGKTTPTSTLVANRFKTTPLPDLWVKSIAADLEPGEELQYFDIVVRDAQGKLYFAPNIKIIIK